MTEVLTAAQIAEIEARAKDIRRRYSNSLTQADKDREAMIATVRAKDARIAELEAERDRYKKTLESIANVEWVDAATGRAVVEK